MTVTKISLNHYGLPVLAKKQWKADMAEMLKAHLRGEPIFVEFDGSYDSRRKGSIGRLQIKNVQDLLHGEYEDFRWIRRNGTPRKVIDEVEKNVVADHFDKIRIDGMVEWDKRRNRVTAMTIGMFWLKGYDASKGTNWQWLVPQDKAIPVVKDKLDREIKVGDFISYILYHFDNSGNAAGIYYGKVTKITNEGNVFAKNIKLTETDHTAEKRIKDPSLIVIMSKDLMDRLVMARLSIL